MFSCLFVIDQHSPGEISHEDVESVGGRTFTSETSVGIAQRARNEEGKQLQRSTFVQISLFKLYFERNP